MRTARAGLGAFVEYSFRCVRCRAHSLDQRKHGARGPEAMQSLGGLILTLCRFQVAVPAGVQRESGALEVALARSNGQTKQVTHRI